MNIAESSDLVREQRFNMFFLTLSRVLQIDGGWDILLLRSQW